jgi:hypothetical protein
LRVFWSAVTKDVFYPIGSYFSWWHQFIMHQAGQSGSIILEAGNEVIKNMLLSFEKRIKVRSTSIVLVPIVLIYVPWLIYNFLNRFIQQLFS